MQGIRFELDAENRELHFHEEMEIIYILSGRAGVMLTGRNTLLLAEDLMVLNPLEYHDIYKEAGCHMISVFIPIAFLQECGLGMVFCCSSMQPEQAEYMDLIRGKLAVIYKNHLEYKDDRRAYILSEIYGILAILKERFSVESTEDPGKYGAGAVHMREILFYMHRHYTENLTLEKLAAGHFLSPSYLSRQFENYLGMHFSDYLKQLRVWKAEKLLINSEKSVTEISEECGYGNPNTFIIHFRELYGVTPGAYRRRQEKERVREMEEREYLQKENSGKKANPDEDVYYVNLLKHAEREEQNEPLHKRTGPSVIVHKDIRQTEGAFPDVACYAVCFSYAKFYFKDGVREMLQKCIRDIGFSYIFINGIFDEAMAVYHEDEEGMPWYQFTFLDMLLDDICAEGARPWIELGRIPAEMVDNRWMTFEKAYVQMPSDLKKWGDLVEAALVHFLERYGTDVENWRFSVFPALYAFYGVFSMQEWLKFYLATFQAVRKKLPKAVLTGGTFDTGLLKLDGDEILQEFLTFCRENDCMPDELSLQCFAVDYGGLEKTVIESSIRNKGNHRGIEPAPPSRDPDKLKNDLLFVRSCLEKRGLEKLPLSVLYWNSSMWQNDLGSDTCFKAAYVVKSVLENLYRVKSLNYTQLFDSAGTESGEGGRTSFNGEQGLFTAQGIPKAAYYAYTLLARLGPVLVDRKEGYCITASEDLDRIQILLYNYGHYNLDVHIGVPLPWEEQMTIDRYYYFDDRGMQNFQFYLTGLEAGKYRVERYLIDREAGSSYDFWRKIGAPDKITEMQRQLLADGSKPSYQYTERQIAEEEEVLLSETLDCHAVMLILMENMKK